MCHFLLMVKLLQQGFGWNYPFMGYFDRRPDTEELTVDINGDGVVNFKIS